jgi:glyoxylase-like metal-dependent hydrolase (beta-lactamase superfamily II)
VTQIPLPPVEQVRPGLWSIPVPIPDNPLRYVLVYAFETDGGLYLVDAGWNTDDAYDTLVAGMAHIGGSISDVRGVLITHIHPDHYGLAGRVRETSGAWVGLHPADAALIQDRYDDPEELLERMAAMLRRTGAPTDELPSLQHAAMTVRKFVSLTKPDVLIEDGARPDVPGWDLTAVWTPGHSPGHLCFWELPRITPNIGYHPQSGENPLGHFLDSLDKLRPYGHAHEVLPAHEHRFVGLECRLDQLIEHHEARFDEVLGIIRNGFDTAYGVASQMHWSRAWDSIQGFMRRAAVGEAMAHLKALEFRGVLREEMGEPARWVIVGSD